MKKIFTLTILSLMLVLTIANSCSKSSDSSTPATTPTPTAIVGVDSIVVDGAAPIELVSVGCLVGAANIFTMTFADPQTDLIYLKATFSAQPTTAATYNVVFVAPPANTTNTDVQLQYSETGLTGAYYVSQKTGTATLTFVNNKIQLSFTKIPFIHGTTTKVVSSILLCN
jgi:hypothetical protein